MKRVNITTLTIGLALLILLLTMTMIPQCISRKEGFAGGGKPAKFFTYVNLSSSQDAIIDPSLIIQAED